MINQDTYKPQIMKLWGITNGPIAYEEIPEEEYEPYVEGKNFLVAFKASYPNGYVEENFEVWFNSFDEAYDIKRYLETSVEPIELEIWE